MKKVALVFGVFFIFAVATISAAACPPNIPVTYYGSVFYDGNVLVGEYNIAIMINGELAGNSGVSAGTYFVDVSPCYGTTSGTVNFVVNSVVAEEEVEYIIENFGREVELDLTLNELPPQENVCGNGDIDAGEECDDNNINNSDGCSSICEVEYGYSCVEQPSVCSVPVNPSCGDGDCNNGESCSSCSRDCGSCNNPKDSGGGKSPSGTTPFVLDSPSDVINNSLDKKVLDITISEEEDKINEEVQLFMSRITGAAVGFSKTKTGIGVLVAIFALILLVFISHAGKKGHIKKENGVSEKAKETKVSNPMLDPEEIDG